MVLGISKVFRMDHLISLKFATELENGATLNTLEDIMEL